MRGFNLRGVNKLRRNVAPVKTTHNECTSTARLFLACFPFHIMFISQGARVVEPRVHGSVIMLQPLLLNTKGTF
jgi:hypothetical protein